MSKRLLYLFGDPGTGKITVARLLERALGWKLFWLHDLDEVCKIVGRYPVPRLMDDVSCAVLGELMSCGQDIIYVRPSRSQGSITRVQGTAHMYGYEVTLVRLMANYSTLVERVESRGLANGQLHTRIGCKRQLDSYLDARPPCPIQEEERCIDTTHVPPEDVAARVLEILRSYNPRVNDVLPQQDMAVRRLAECH